MIVLRVQKPPWACCWRSEACSFLKLIRTECCGQVQLCLYCQLIYKQLWVSQVDEALFRIEYLLHYTLTRYMSTTPFLGFSLRDTLTRLIPGLLFLTPVLIVALVLMSNTIPESTIFLVLLGLSAYLVGEFIDQLRTGLFRVPMGFRYFVYKETNDMSNMPIHYRYIINIQQKLPEGLDFYLDYNEEQRLANEFDFEFREDIETKLGVDFNDNRPREIYDLLLIYMEGSFTRRLRRLQSMSRFGSNIRIASVGSLFFMSIYLIPFRHSIFAKLAWFTAFVVAVTVLSLGSFFTLFQQHYDELLMKEYYMKRIQEKEN